MVSKKVSQPFDGRACEAEAEEAEEDKTPPFPWRFLQSGACGSAEDQQPEGPGHGRRSPEDGMVGAGKAAFSLLGTSLPSRMSHEQ